MCEPISIGIAIGAATGAAGAAVTGGDVLQGALFGGVAGGLGGAGFGLTPGITSSVQSSLLFNTSLSAAASAGVGAGLVGGVTSTLGSVAMSTLFPQQDYSQYYNQAGSNPIAYNTQQSVVTGSGGRQAAAVLASEIKQAKKVRQRQAEEATDFGLGVDLAGTGLQIA